VTIEPYRGVLPRIHPEAFVHAAATLIGDIEIGPKSSIWPATVLRGDDGPIRIGAETSIQDGSVVHMTTGLSRTTIGDRVQIGSDTTLVAPVEIGDDAYVATATTVRHDVEPGALAFNPKPDQRRPGWVEGFRKRKQAEKKR